MESFDFREELKKILASCVDKMWKNDHYLLESKIHECSISFRIGYYLQNELDALKKSGKLNILKNLAVDAEYNKCLNGQKICIDEFGRESTMRPDLIVHIRGRDGIDNNFMVIEIKKNVGGACETDRDYTKLKYLTSDKCKFQYQIGAHVVVGLTKEIRWFKDGLPED